MNHLPRLLFGHRKQPGMDSKKKTRRKQPKLERRNAAKHFEYDAGSSTSSRDSSSSLYTRSVELYDRTSFRIEGVEGEFDRICRSLGLSGPEDFSIPPAAWEAMKVRSSSDIFPRLKHGDSDEESKQKEEIEVGRPKHGDDGDEGKEKEEIGVPECGDQARLPVRGENSVCCAGGGGINGFRPPMLKPPPGIRVSAAVDDACSTWDIFRGFAPKEEEGKENCAELNGSDDDGGREAMEEEGEEENALMIAEIVGEFSACSFTTSNEDDSSSTSTDPRSNNISPNGTIRRVITPGNWEKGDLLGRGSFGSVYEGISEGGIFFAVKEVSLFDQGNQGKQSLYQLKQEIDLLSQFEHENIVQYIGTETDESNLYIFLELVTKGSLRNLYQSYKLWDSQVSAYTRQILHGLKYLHNLNIVHRDIKCANILVDANGSVKLADFGLAKAIKLNDVKSCKGTAFWMAPEVVKGKVKGYGLPADIWSLGCTVLEMLTGKIPYSHLECMQALYRIGSGEPPPVPDSLSRDARDFILQCLKVDPNERPTAAELLSHAFVQRPLSRSSGSASPYIQRG